MVTGLFPVDENRGFIVDSSKIEQHTLVSPSSWHAKLGRQPGEVSVFTLDAYNMLLIMFV